MSQNVLVLSLSVRGIVVDERLKQPVKLEFRGGLVLHGMADDLKNCLPDVHLRGSFDFSKVRLIQ